MISLNIILAAAALTWTIAMYPIYPFLGLISALMAIGLFFQDETIDKPIKARCN